MAVLDSLGRAVRTNPAWRALVPDSVSTEGPIHLVACLRAITGTDDVESVPGELIRPSADSQTVFRLDLQSIEHGGLKYAGDLRVTTFVIMNSGILDKSVPQAGEMAADKSLLDRIKVPTLYVLGGVHDIAYGNGMDDFGRLNNAPAVVINTDVTHSGTYLEPNGGRAAQAVVAWLDWQLRGDQEAGRWFEGPDCRLCVDPAWTVKRRNF